MIAKSKPFAVRIGDKAYVGFICLNKTSFERYILRGSLTVILD